MSKKFSDLGINKELQQSLLDLNIVVPTLVQEKTIPPILNETKDIVVLAKTGTGKTAAFGLPLLQLIDIKNPTIQAVILAPTRELGQQIYTNLVSIAACSPSIVIVPIFGGIPIKPQIESLKSSPNIIDSPIKKETENTTAIQISNFRQFVDYFYMKREALLHAQLYNSVKLISFKV